MTYGLKSKLFAEDGAAERPLVHSGRWRKLDDEHRLEAVDRALSAPANDLIDGYPLAL